MFNFIQPTVIAVVFIGFQLLLPKVIDNPLALISVNNLSNQSLLFFRNTQPTPTIIQEFQPPDRGGLKKSRGSGTR